MLVVTAAALAAGGVLTVAALAAEPLVRHDLVWPLACLENWRAGAFRPDPAHPAIDPAALAEKARRDLPGHIAFADELDGSMLVVGPIAGSWDMGPLRRWRDLENVPLLGPDPIAISSSVPDWFSAPRRGHDLAVAGVAVAFASIATALFGALRRAR